MGTVAISVMLAWLVLLLGVSSIGTWNCNVVSITPCCIYLSRFFRYPIFWRLAGLRVLFICLLVMITIPYRGSKQHGTLFQGSFWKKRFACIIPHYKWRSCIRKNIIHKKNISNKLCSSEFNTSTSRDRIQSSNLRTSILLVKTVFCSPPPNPLFFVQNIFF